jgi:hypothetical protein
MLFGKSRIAAGIAIGLFSHRVNRPQSESQANISLVGERNCPPQQQ